MKKKHELSLKQKLILAFIVLITANIFAYLCYTYFMLESIKVNKEAQQAYTQAWNISAALNNVNHQMNLFAMGGNLEHLYEYEKLRDSVLHDINALEATTDNNDEIVIIRALKNSIEPFLEKYDLAAQEKLADNDYYFLNYYEGSRILSYISVYVAQYRDSLIKLHGDKVHLIEKETEIVFFSIASFLLSFTIIYIIFALSFIDKLTLPIQNLVNAAKRISQGDYNFEDIPVKNEDELGKLTTTFNFMKKDISQAIEYLQDRVTIEKVLNDVKIKEIQNARLLNEAQYLALQSQMNPHFLFNTLNAISRSIECNDPSTSIHLVHKLATICRYNLDHISTYSTIEQELYVTESYIYIQQFRFESRLKYSVQCDDECLFVLIPGLIIQPLVENALKHGIENSEGGGKIFVQIKKVKNGISLRVYNTGKGMPKDKIRKITEDLVQSDNLIENFSGIGIGLGNMAKRIKLIEHGNFKIMSRKQGGTLVKIYLPIQ